MKILLLLEILLLGAMPAKDSSKLSHSVQKVMYIGITNVDFRGAKFISPDECVLARAMCRQLHLPIGRVSVGIFNCHIYGPGGAVATSYRIVGEYSEANYLEDKRKAITTTGTIRVVKLIKIAHEIFD